MTNLSDPPSVQPNRLPKTAAEAMVRADAKEGIRDAKLMRVAGYGLAGVGAARTAALMLREDLHILGAARNFMRITFIPGHVYGFDFQQALYFFAIPVGLVIGIVGHILLNKRVTKAISDPDKIAIFHPDEPW